MIIRRKNKNNLLRSELFWIMMLAAYFEPAYFSRLSIIDLIYDVMKIASLFISIVLVIKNRKLPIVFLGATIYYALLFLITFVRYGDIKTVLFQFMVVIGSVSTLYLMSVYIPDKTIKCALIVFEFLIYGNFISVLVAPRGLYRYITVTGWWTDACWLLGIRNGMTLTYLVALYLEWVNFYFDKREKKRFIIFIIVASVTVYAINYSSSRLIGSGSAGGLVTCWLCVLLFFILPRKIPFLNFANAFFIQLAFFILLVFFRIQRVFSFFIESFLHKTATLTGRVYLWQRVLQAIKKSLFWGYGIEYGKNMANRLRAPASVNTTQNGFLDIIYTGGVTLFCVFLIMMIIYIVVVSSYSSNMELDTFVGYSTLVFFLCCQSESMIGARFFFYLQLIMLTYSFFSTEEIQIKLHKELLDTEISNK
ncbi:O-antigen ligase family protein [Butyrivibrio sp. MC2013]|uniref:O-antigen ligase family protein n=1 Tax=Butyrivibrio sp. MC2013 TaxID=1280686 RepID=UPI000428B758|nr:O-antigen ligase family protein [Butyrivibrio sp. MC2013]